MAMPDAKVTQGDVLAELAKLPGESVNCCVTSPPYWGLRDYGVEGQIGLEPTPGEYITKTVRVFAEVRRVLRDDGTCWVNMGDGYAQSGGPGWRGKNGQRVDRRFTATRDTAAMREIGRRPPDGSKPKDIIGMPWRVALALQQPHLACLGCGAVSHRSAWGSFPNGRLICPACEKSAGHEVDTPGWYLRSDIIWHKPNPMPESVTDRCTKAHEYIFLLTKSARYWWDAEAVKEGVSGTAHKRQPKDGAAASMAFKMDQPGKGNRNNPSFQQHMQDLDPSLGRNRRSVWTIPTERYPGAHFATFPTEIPKLCILAGCPAGGTVLDPFAGSGTTGQVALELGRNAILIELNPKYVGLIRQRLAKVTPGFALTTPAQG